MLPAPVIALPCVSPGLLVVAECARTLLNFLGDCPPLRQPRPPSTMATPLSSPTTFSAVRPFTFTPATGTRRSTKSLSPVCSPCRLKPHYLLYDIISVIRWLIPYTYRKILEMLFKLLKLCFHYGEQAL